MLTIEANGAHIPAIGLGTWELRGRTCSRIVEQAIRLGYRALRGREGMGGGDPKLFGAIGLWVGWTMLPIVLVLACLVGLGVVLFWLITDDRVQKAVRLPFGTLLAIAAYPAWIALLAWGR
jgi:leader peptidase (prepilin peptidase)/N-methyltransferase